MIYIEIYINVLLLLDLSESETENSAKIVNMDQYHRYF